MRPTRKLAVFALLLASVAPSGFSTAAAEALPAPGAAGAPDDIRYCGEPPRDSRGRIVRSARVLRDFVREFPGPTTLERVASCEGWQLDHFIALASGGCDAQVNLQWLPVLIKTCAGKVCKDRWERKYHSYPRRVIELE